MKKPTDLLQFSDRAFFTARLLLLLELNKTHGDAFASAFLEEFRIEVLHAYETVHRHE